MKFLWYSPVIRLFFFSNSSSPLDISKSKQIILGAINQNRALNNLINSESIAPRPRMIWIVSLNVVSVELKTIDHRRCPVRYHRRGSLMLILFPRQSFLCNASDKSRVHTPYHTMPCSQSNQGPKTLCLPLLFVPSPA